MTAAAQAYLAARWPYFYHWLAAAFLLVVALVGVGLGRGWYALLPLAALVVLVVVYVATAAIRMAQSLQDYRKISDVIWQIGDLSLRDSLLVINFGDRLPAIHLSRKLSLGRVTLLDIYNPAIFASATMVHMRAQFYQQQETLRPDPRLSHQNADIDFLPLNDGSAETVILNQVLSNLGEAQDRQRLLAEVARSLRAGGKLIVVEAHKSPHDIFQYGLGYDSLVSAEAWHQLLRDADYQPIRTQSINTLLTCFYYEKKARQGVQLKFSIFS